MTDWGSSKFSSDLEGAPIPSVGMARVGLTRHVFMTSPNALLQGEARSRFEN